MPLVASTHVILPAVKTLRDCANYTIAVEPFLPQLQTLPHQLFHHLSSLEDLKSLYLSTNPLVTALAFAIFLSSLCLVVSEINKNVSQVDRLWSLLPSVYNLHYTAWAHMHGLPTQRLDNILVFSLAWSARLTFNYWRKGGYSVGTEDYRWPIIKARVPSWAFFLFNVTFISLYQNILLCCITTPTYVLLLASRLTQSKMTVADVLFARFLMGLVVFEYFADQQQWDFHQAKRTYLDSAKVPAGFSQQALDRGFITSGLWGYSRHPNFLAEQSVWVTLALWGCWKTGTLNWTLIGAVNYLMVFQGSTWLTEKISSGKYPDYKEYQQRVGRFLPRISGLGLASWARKEAEEQRGRTLTRK